MKRTLVLALFALLALAQSPKEILDRVEANLRTPWQASLQGVFRGPTGTEEFRARLYALPQEETYRIEFLAPSSLQGNFTVITPKEVWNYLYLTNQLVIAPKERAQVQGLGFSPQALGDLQALLDRVELRLLGEERTPEGLAYRLQGVAKGEGLGFESLEAWILKEDPRPLRLRFRDEAGGVLADLRFLEFRRANLKAQDLRRYPRDAQVVRR